MNNSASYIKDIEQFFLNLSQKGVMLSSKDYHLIQEWMEKGYGLERVLFGIKKAFENRSNIRSLQDCIEYIESEVEKKSEINVAPKGIKQNEYITKIINNFSRLTESEKNQKLAAYYREYTLKLKTFLNRETGSLFNLVNDLEEQFFLEFHKNLDKTEAEIHLKKLNDFINSGNDYINEKAKNKALNNHSKNLIINNYLGSNPFKN